MGSQAAATRALTKTYGSTAAVGNFTCEMHRGRIYGLIGRNGAGKTTLMRMLCGLVLPTSGRIELFGDDGGGSAQADRRRVGCLIEEPPYYHRL